LGDGELDKTHTDLEIVDSWNEFYDKYGHHFPEFKRKWEREFLPTKEEENKRIRESEKMDDSDSEFNEEERVKSLEKIKNLFNKKTPYSSDLG
jgi:hypothetical protein